MITSSQIIEALNAADKNRVETKNTIKCHQIALPWPDEPKARAFFLQPVDRANWEELRRNYRVKSGICKGMLIIASIATYEGEVWYHVSFSFRESIPTYEQTVWLRTAMFPPHLKALHVFPPVDEHFSLHPNCLHLWANLERDPLPDFRTAGMV
jgi:hypothetical protein